MTTTPTPSPLPTDLDTAIAQARQATRAAIEDGQTLLQVELLVGELKAQTIAEQFLPELLEMGKALRVMFPDMGATALARRDWGEERFKISDLGSDRRPVDTQIADEDECFLVVEPSDVEIAQVEKLYLAAAGRPVVLLLPRLENVATIGIGYAGRQLRDRFLSKIETCYYIRPLDGATLYRAYPSPWQVWGDAPPPAVGEELLAETATKPAGEALDRILMGEDADADASDAPTAASTKKSPGLMAGLQNFLKALSQ